LSKNEKNSSYIICPKFIGQNKKISQTGEILSSILETFLRNSKVPKKNERHEKEILNFPMLPKLLV